MSAVAWAITGLTVTGGAVLPRAHAQPKATIEEVTVYAQRREQSVQDVPISITAYGGNLLNRLGIVELDALSDITPGLVIQEQSPNNPGFVIRGITSDSGSAQAAPRVSVYYNGVDVSRSRGSGALFRSMRATTLRASCALTSLAATKLCKVALLSVIASETVSLTISPAPIVPRIQVVSGRMRCRPLNELRCGHLCDSPPAIA
ncbi:MAG: Plug domain-containing protein [Pseudomonadota bacterium]